MSTMVSLELPHITVLSKCDLVDDKKMLKKYCKLEYGKTLIDAGDDEHIKAFHAAEGKVENMDWDKLDKDGMLKQDANYEVGSRFSQKYTKLTERIKDLVNNYNLVSLLPLDCNDPETIQAIIYHADNNIQYGEQKEPDENTYFEAEDKLRAEFDPNPPGMDFE